MRLVAPFAFALRSRPPPPPPVTYSIGLPSTPLQHLYCALHLAFWLWLLWLRFFSRKPSLAFKNAHAWVNTIVVLLAMPLAHGAIQDACSMSVPTPSTGSRMASMYEAAPLIVFPLTVIEGLLLLYLANKGAETPPSGSPMVISWFFHLIIASTVAATAFYLLDEVFGRCNLEGIFGRPLHPFHYFMWMVTMHLDCQAIHGLARSQLPESPLLKLGRERRMLDALIGTQVIFHAALVANWVRPVSALQNGTLLLVAFCAFSFVCYRNHQSSSDMARASISEQVAQRITFINFAVALKWGLYTVIWCVAACDLISTETEAALLTTLDLIKAFLAVAAWSLTL